MKVLQFAGSLGQPLPQLLVSCEPQPLSEDMQMGRSEPVAAAVKEAVHLIEALPARLLAREDVRSLEAVFHP